MRHVFADQLDEAGKALDGEPVGDPVLPEPEGVG